MIHPVVRQWARTPGRLSALLLVIAVGLYAQSVGHDFHYDDFHSVVHNPHIQELEGIPHFFTDPSLFSVNPESAMYRPVLLATYAANFAAGEGAPAGFHAVSVILHAINVVLVFQLLMALRQPVKISFMSALLFAVHPINSEAVNYISSRSELLMATFFLSACLCYLRPGGSRIWHPYVASLLFTALALLTKSVAVMLVPVLALLDWWRGGWQLLRARWRWYIPSLGLALIYVGTSERIINKALLEPVRRLDAQIWTQLKALIYSLFLAGVPVKLNADHQFLVSKSPDAVVIVALLALVSAGAVIWSLRKGRWPPLVAGWSALVLAPSFAVPLIVLFNEHRLYLAFIGVSLAISWGLHRALFFRGAFQTPIAALFAAILLIFTVQRSAAWADEVSLWSDAVSKSPSMVKPHLRLADALAERGRLEEAAYLSALTLRPAHPAVRNNLGRLYRKQGRLREAQDQFEAILAMTVHNIPARLNLAGLLQQQGNWQGAREQYERVLEFSHTNGVAQAHLGRIALHYQGRPDVAVGFYDAGLAVAPDDRNLLVGRGVARRALGQHALAEADYRRALASDSLFVDAWYNLGNLLRETGRSEQARRSFEHVVSIDADTELSRLAANQILQLKSRSYDQGE